MLPLDQTTSLYRLLGDATRLRLLVLLEREELSVAELVQITQLAQSRVSTHLAKLKEAGLIRDRRVGVSAYYAWNGTRLPAGLLPIWETLRTHLDDTVLDQDIRRLDQALLARQTGQSWAESVAGEMERHYSPGRSFETTALALFRLMTLGDVVDVGSGDGAIAEQLAPAARHVHCIDISEKIIDAARKRLASADNTAFSIGDMHALPCEDRSADVVLMLNTLTWSNNPASAAAENARILRAGGKVLVTTLHAHRHQDVVAEYGHSNLGFTEQDLSEHYTAAGLQIEHCQILQRETRAPHFEVLLLLASKP